MSDEMQNLICYPNKACKHIGRYKFSNELLLIDFFFENNLLLDYGKLVGEKLIGGTRYLLIEWFDKPSDDIYKLRSSEVYNIESLSDIAYLYSNLSLIEFDKFKSFEFKNGIDFALAFYIKYMENEKDQDLENVISEYVKNNYELSERHLDELKTKFYLKNEIYLNQKLISKISSSLPKNYCVHTIDLSENLFLNDWSQIISLFSIFPNLNRLFLNKCPFLIDEKYISLGSDKVNFKLVELGLAYMAVRLFNNLMVLLKNIEVENLNISGNMLGGLEFAMILHEIGDRCTTISYFDNYRVHLFDSLEYFKSKDRNNFCSLRKLFMTNTFLDLTTTGYHDLDISTSNRFFNFNLDELWITTKFSSINELFYFINVFNGLNTLKIVYEHNFLTYPNDQDPKKTIEIIIISSMQKLEFYNGASVDNERVHFEHLYIDFYKNGYKNLVNDSVLKFLVEKHQINLDENSIEVYVENTPKEILLSFDPIVPIYCEYIYAYYNTEKYLIPISQSDTVVDLKIKFGSLDLECYNKNNLMNELEYLHHQSVIHIVKRFELI